MLLQRTRLQPTYLEFRELRRLLLGSAGTSMHVCILTHKHTGTHRCRHTPKSVTTTRTICLVLCFIIPIMNFYFYVSFLCKVIFPLFRCASMWCPHVCMHAHLCVVSQGICMYVYSYAHLYRCARLIQPLLRQGLPFTPSFPRDPLFSLPKAAFTRRLCDQCFSCWAVSLVPTPSFLMLLLI